MTFNDIEEIKKQDLRQYFGFRQGNNIGHYGGRLIWQLKYSRLDCLLENIDH